jgi:hypothetical protein
MFRSRENIDYLQQHPEIQAEHVGKCQNPPELRQKSIKDLMPSDLHCFHAILVETQRGNLLNCDTTQSFKHIHWLYDNLPLDMKLHGAYEHLENGSLALYQQDAYVHRFQCAIDYVVGVSR